MSFDVVGIVSVVGIVLFSMILHELMHGLTAYWLGDDTAKHAGRLTLNPLSHIDPLTTVLVPVLLYIGGLPPFGVAKPVPFNPNRVRYGEFGAALVGIAGPLTNLVLAFVAYGLSLVFAADGAVANFLWLAVSVNLSFFAFNILPIPPLDGSRVLYAIAPDFVRRGMEAMERYGIIVIFALVLLAGSFFSNIIGAISIFMIHLFMAVYGR
jgi:Zn-dependent protease